jgi:DNA-binding NarL/FixJ family response regulator
MNTKIKVLVADDHLHERRGFIELLRLAGDIQDVGEATSAAEAVQKAIELQPDVVLMDLEWFNDASAGAEAIRQMKATAPRVKILAATVHPELIDMARRAGAEVAVDKDTLFSADSLAARIRDAFRTEPQVMRGGPVDDLSGRELEILQLVVKGKTNQAIADTLNIALPTVKHHVQNILQKLGVTSRTEAAVAAMQRGIL